MENEDLRRICQLCTAEELKHLRDLCLEEINEGNNDLIDDLMTINAWILVRDIK